MQQDLEQPPQDRHAAPQMVDVIVVGGGPAGSTIGSLLAQRGFDVALIEKDHHPRFHIGESLLPCNVPLLEQLGVADQVQRIGMLKLGVDFVSPTHNKQVSFEFKDAWDKSLPYSFQVRRSEFDHVLLTNAGKQGVVVHEGWRVGSVDLEADRPGGHGVAVVAVSEGGERREWRARFLVDASGRDTLLASKLGIKDRNRRHASAAMYGHYTGARRQDGPAEGNISIFWFEHGWIWFIPLADGTTSIGVVCPPAYLKSRDTDVTSFFLRTIATAPELMARLQGATLTGPVTATGNYSYRAQRMVGRNYVMIGDAYAFIDPVFSTGVYLAMHSAFRAADAVELALREAGQGEQALARYAAMVDRGLDRFSWFIYRMNQPALRDLFMNPRNVLRLQEAVLAMLSGDVFRPSPVHARLALFKGLYYANSLVRRVRGTLPHRAQPVPNEAVLIGSD